MNELVKELAEKAHSYADDLVVYEPENSGLFELKFAELIVQKCISQIALIGISNFENEDIMWTVQTAISSIEEHFGLK